MLNLSNLRPKFKRTARKRVGRGNSSGQGTFAGRGTKGQKARTGGKIRPGFEGGRMPLIRQIPKVRGFKSIYLKPQIVKLRDIVRRFTKGGKITPRILWETNLIGRARLEVKVIGKAPVLQKYDFTDIKLSASAKALVEKAGGTAAATSETKQP